MVVLGLCAQTSPVFEVASIKQEPWTGSGGVYVVVRGNTLNAEHSCLKDLVSFAWRLEDFQLSGGPAWAEHGRLDQSDLYQVIAKAPGDTAPPEGQFRLMLQALLADRFHLQVHHVQKEVPVYWLVVAQGGPKLVESAPDAKFSMAIDSGRGSEPTRMRATHVSIDKLLWQLGHYAGRPVLDRTGLTGFYDFDVEWSPNSLTADAEGPSVFAALQKFGLKLEGGKASFDTVVIDRAEKPSEN
jgi:uncharacterized protein (TIGR03435 family)